MRMLMAVVICTAVLVNGQTAGDTSSVLSRGTQRIADSLSTNLSGAQKQQVQKIKIIKKDVDYSTFVKLAVGMMAYIAIIYTTTQTWNPSD
jgi:hypothetical protein